jgi:phenylalanyl-tRNA synthetase alpha chain
MLDQLKQSFLDNLQEIKTEEDLRNLEIKFLGRKSELNNQAKKISDLPKEERKDYGQKINLLKQFIFAEIKKKKTSLEDKILKEVLDKEWVDVTIPPKDLKTGSRHPISLMIDHIVDVFTRLGFSQAEGPELETEWYNFTALNVPEDHPAREMQDTFFVEGDKNNDKYVLRTQTSCMQIRYMEEHKAPLRIFAPGKTFRKDSDATHSPMFHQVEGLMVDENISLANLKAVLLQVFKELLEEDNLDIRLRLSYFPFVEPGLEVDIAFLMNGKKKWFELAGAGMVHPQVLKNGGIDPEVYNGFAFGIGIDRLVMIKHNIQNIRTLFENDPKFLKQF